MRTYRSFQEAYLATLRSLAASGATSSGVSDPTSVGSGFGASPRATREILADAFTIEDPRERLVRIPARRLSTRFLVANTVWTIAGGHEAGMIAAYNARARDFARDRSYFEASFGARLFSPGNQLRHVERRLRADPESRRGTAVIYAPEDTLTDRLDVPCALALQFLIREGRLHAIAIMRSQSAAMVMPYDVFLFTMLQEILAVRLGIPLGHYIHTAGSMHYYQEEEDLIQKILADGIRGPSGMPAMQEASDRMLEEVVQAEQEIRLASRFNRDPIAALAKFELDLYWRTFLEPLFQPEGLSGTYWTEISQ